MSASLESQREATLAEIQTRRDALEQAKAKERFTRHVQDNADVHYCRKQLIQAQARLDEIDTAISKVVQQPTLEDRQARATALETVREKVHQACEAKEHWQRLSAEAQAAWNGYYVRADIASRGPWTVVQEPDGRNPRSLEEITAVVEFERAKARQFANDKYLIEKNQADWAAADERRRTVRPEGEETAE